ncbi:MAG: CRISPR-associated protein Csx16 [Gammaproteobacteria bacterium]|nr:CRISPR-associated protein Csx16 [Gammaproteobacteria bacterium]
MIYLISRHPGAVEWLQQKIREPTTHIRHLERLEVIAKGDIVIGTMPINLVADICRRGARYLHLQLDLPEQLRGQELSADMLNELGASLVEYIALQPQSVMFGHG